MRGLIVIAFLVCTIPYLCSAQSQPAEKPQLTVGLFADCQYADIPPRNKRQYQLSLGKLAECVKTLNDKGPFFVVQLGDLIDRDYKIYAAVQSILANLKPELNSVLGNHDFSVEDAQKGQIPALLDMPNRYYDILAGNWRFIVLDGNELSLHAWPAGSEQDKASREYYEKFEVKPSTYTGAIGPEQIEWLKNVLNLAETSGQPVVIFSHFPILPIAKDNLWNASEVVELIEKHPSVKAYVCGHNHAGNYNEKEGIHYLNLKGMVDTTENAFAVMEFYANRMEVIGFGREPSRTLAIRPRTSVSTSQPALVTGN